MGSLFTFVGIQNEGECPQCTNSWIKSKRLTLHITYNGKIQTLKIQSLLLIHRLKELLHDKFGVEPRLQKLIFYGDELLDGDTLIECQLSDQDTIKLVSETRGIKSDKMHYNYRTCKIIIGREHGVFGKTGTKTIEIASYHVSCKSNQIKGQDMVGVVLYSYNKKTEWGLNGIHCKSGYVILKSSKDIQNINNKQGRVHGKCYKSVFGEEIAYDKVVGGGFAFKNNKW
eukprot:289767_1